MPGIAAAHFVQIDGQWARYQIFFDEEDLDDKDLRDSLYSWMLFQLYLAAKVTAHILD